MKKNNRMALRMSMRMKQKQTFRIIATSGLILAFAVLTSIYIIHTQEGMSKERTILKPQDSINNKKPVYQNKIQLQEMIKNSQASEIEAGIEKKAGTE